MSLTLAAALIAATSTLPVCSWDKPGQNPFMGDVVNAIDRYHDIPKDVRDTLKKRMAKRQYDDIATIKRDNIVGSKNATYSNLRDMHFGSGNICKTITRAKWTTNTTERGLVYCEKNHCIIVPTVCRNVSRVTKKEEAPLEFETAAGPTKEEPVESPPTKLAEAPLDFETAAGPTLPPVATITPTVVPPPPDAFPSFPTFPSTQLPPLISITPAIPEPNTLLMWIVGLISLALLRNQKV